MGWNCRGWGWAAEQIVGIDVVTADGNSVHCDETINSDLFWSARGSGSGFFGVVTQFHLQSRLLPVGMLASTYVWDISEYDAVMPWVIETSRIADPDIEIVALALYPHNTENAPSDQRLNLVVRLLTFNGSVDTARKSLEVFSTSVPRKDAALVMDEYAVTSIAKEVMDQYKQNPEGHRYTADNVWLHSNLPTSQVVDTMRNVFT
jgi:FAD/FMN-containing dehydrogenase